MAVTERNRDDRYRLARLIAKESNAVQQDRLRSVLLELHWRETLEIAGGVGRSRALVRRWAYTYRDRGRDVDRPTLTGRWWGAILDRRDTGPALLFSTAVNRRHSTTGSCTDSTC